MKTKTLVMIALAMGVASVAAADPPKAALGVPAGGQEATIRAAWKAWVKSAPWTEAAGPSAAVVTACLATDASCGGGLAALKADRTWIVTLDPPATPGGEPFVSGRVYDGAGALITSSQRACARCATNRATLTAEVGKLLDGLRDAVEHQSTRLVIELDAPGAQVQLDGAPVEPAAAGLPVTPGAHQLTIAGDCWDLAPMAVVVSSGETVHAKLAATARAPRLRIRTHPAGVRVEIDGAAAGASTGGSLEVATAAGSHRVRAAGDGWQAAEQSVTVNGCESKDVDLVLLHRAPRSKLPIITAIGGGVAVVGGLALVLADRDQINGPVRSATYRNSAPLGGLVTAVGVAAIGVSYYLWRREPPLVPAVQPTEGGAAAGVAGRF